MKTEKNYMIRLEDEDTISETKSIDSFPQVNKVKALIASLTQGDYNYEFV